MSLNTTAATPPKSIRKPAHRGRLPDGAANPVDIHVGRRLRLRRTLMGYSQESLGAALGLTFQQVQKYERGGNRISASRLYDLSNVLDVPVSYFFDDMSDEARSHSPAALIKGDAGPMAPATPYLVDPMAKRETLELVRAYYAIPAHLRPRVYDLAKAMAQQAQAAG